MVLRQGKARQVYVVICLNRFALTRSTCGHYLVEARFDTA